MKTSVIEVRDMLSVLSVDGVEKRIGEVPGVESVTVNYAAGSATVRYDETRLEVADIKSAVRQRGYESAGESPPPCERTRQAGKQALPVSQRRKLRRHLPSAPAPPPPAAPQKPSAGAHAGNPPPGGGNGPRGPPRRPRGATRATRRRARSPPCRRIWRMRWAMAARTCRPWSATCATVSGSA